MANMGLVSECGSLVGSDGEEVRGRERVEEIPALAQLAPTACRLPHHNFLPRPLHPLLLAPRHLSEMQCITTAPPPPPPADQVVHSYILNSQSGQTHELATSCINSAVQTPDYREYQKIHPVASLLIPGRSICRSFPNEVFPSGGSCSSLHLPSQCAAP